MPDALLIFKPDGAHRLGVRASLWSWLSEERGWRVESLTWWQPPPELIEEHYDFLQGRPFFPWLVDFMSALPLPIGRISATPEVLERMRQDLGETRIAESRPGSLRELHGIFGGINCLHLSDSPESGAKELKLWAGRVALDRIDANLELQSDRPDHTFHLRSLAAQIAGGVHRELAAEDFRKLVREETDLEPGGFESLSRVLLGALA